MTPQSHQSRLYELENELSDLRRRQRERQGSRWGLGRGAVNASPGLELEDLFAKDAEAATAARIAELEAAIAEHQAQDPRRVDELRARDFLTPQRQENDGNAS